MKFDLNFEKVTLIGLGFTSLFTGFSTAANLSSQVMINSGMANLGFYSLAAIYLFFMLGSLISTPIINYLTPRKAVFYGSLANVTWVAFFIVPAYR